MKVALIAVALATSISAHAWGDREQGILTGIVAAQIFNHVANQHSAPSIQGGRIRPDTPQIFYTTPVQRIEHYYPAPQQCVTRIYHNQSGMVVNQVTECR
jgi:hypothetical protein